MLTTTPAAENPAATTDEPDESKRVLDLDDTRAVSIDGATLIECDSYTRTQDGNALRYDGATPLFVVGIYSKGDARKALHTAGYDHADVARAFKNGEWMESERTARADHAIACAERDEVRAEQELVADGGSTLVDLPTRPACKVCDTPANDGVSIDHGEGCWVSDALEAKTRVKWRDLRAEIADRRGHEGEGR